jgi:hypothetical protein
VVALVVDSDNHAIESMVELIYSFASPPQLCEVCFCEAVPVSLGGGGSSFFYLPDAPNGTPSL